MANNNYMFSYSDCGLVLCRLSSLQALPRKGMEETGILIQARRNSTYYQWSGTI